MHAMKMFNTAATIFKMTFKGHLNWQFNTNSFFSQKKLQAHTIIFLTLIKDVTDETVS